MGIIQFQENRLAEGSSDYRRLTIDGAVEIILRGIRKSYFSNKLNAFRI
jgi:hypothetical protein